MHHEATLPIRIGLTQTNLDSGFDHIKAVSDPSSPRYGKYWTPEEVHEACRPYEDAERTVRESLVSASIEEGRVSFYENKGWSAFDATTKEAEALFNTAAFHEHNHRQSDEIREGGDRYVVTSQW